MRPVSSPPPLASAPPPPRQRWQRHVQGPLLLRPPPSSGHHFTTPPSFCLRDTTQSPVPETGPATKPLAHRPVVLMQSALDTLLRHRTAGPPSHCSRTAARATPAIDEPDRAGGRGRRESVRGTFDTRVKWPRALVGQWKRFRKKGRRRTLGVGWPVARPGLHVPGTQSRLRRLP